MFAGLSVLGAVGLTFLGINVIVAIFKSKNGAMDVVNAIVAIFIIIILIGLFMFSKFMGFS